MGKYNDLDLTNWQKYENISTILDKLKKTQNIDYLIEGKKIVIKEVR